MEISSSNNILKIKDKNFKILQIIKIISVMIYKVILHIQFLKININIKLIL